MTRRQHLVSLGLALTAGTAGSIAIHLLSATATKAAAGPSTAPAGRRVIEAEEFRVVDSSGRVRAKMVSTPEDTVFTLCDEKGSPGILIVQPLHGQPGLVLTDAKRRPRLSIGLHTEGEPEVRFKNANGTTTSLWVGGSASGLLSFNDANEKPRVMLGTTSAADLPAGLKTLGNSGSFLCLCDERGLPRADLSLTEHGPGLTLSDRRYRNRVQLFLSSVLQDEPLLLLNDAAGKPIWAAP